MAKRHKETKKILNENWEEILKLREGGIRISAIAAKFNISPQALTARLKQVFVKTTGEVPVHNNLTLAGVTTTYDDEGKVKRQSVREIRPKNVAIEVLQEGVEAFLDSDRVLASNIIASPSEVDTDTMSVYSIGDAHIGMLSWEPEAGEDYDTTVCVSDLLAAINLLVDQAHPSEECFIIDVGDFYHMDSQDNTTTAGTRVDVDSRFAKIIQAGLDITISLIEKALTKHSVVRWRSAVGNHNTHTSLYITSFIKAWFRNDPRVIVHDTPAMFMYHVFGKNLLGITHGHTAKAEKLGEIMSVDCKDQWSNTEHRYWYTGHVHHQTVKEFTNCVVETFNTLTAKDAWHAGQGYRSKQSMKSITLHTEYGEISRNTVSQGLVRAHTKS